MANKKTKGRVSDTIVLQRTNDVYTFLLKGASRQDILQHGREEWDIGESMMDKYIAKARKYFNRRLEMDRDSELGQATERYEMLFQKALKVQDYKTAIQAQARIDKIHGLEVERREISGTDGGAIVIKTGMDVSEL